MGFIAQVQFRAMETLKPTRGYFHEDGYEKAFGTLDMSAKHDGISMGDMYLRGVLQENDRLLGPADFILAFLRGEDGHKIAELFGFTCNGEWPGDPRLQSWVFRNGIYRPESGPVLSGDLRIVLGREEDYRRGTGNNEEYMFSCPPDLGLKDLIYARW